ncbi:hypothetical protein HPB48_018012 [Haemaphysalis longicornis]|uniref:Uncharacterized protein n=1 Tax=Haemaphysalis longicornis TaxID=44386 RepID=A0A9J6FIV0_HAELO|nr:hypothetical protein HPB48_018012 [Haemaphysalis longicornis]
MDSTGGDEAPCLSRKMHPRSARRSGRSAAGGGLQLGEFTKRTTTGASTARGPQAARSGNPRRRGLSEEVHSRAATSAPSGRPASRIVRVFSAAPRGAAVTDGPAVNQGMRRRANGSAATRRAPSPKYAPHPDACPASFCSAEPVPLFRFGRNDTRGGRPGDSLGPTKTNGAQAAPVSREECPWHS